MARAKFQAQAGRTRMSVTAWAIAGVHASHAVAPHADERGTVGGDLEHDLRHRDLTAGPFEPDFEREPLVLLHAVERDTRYAPAPSSEHE